MNLRGNIFDTPERGEIELLRAGDSIYGRNKNPASSYIPSSQGERFIIVDQEQASQAKGDSKMSTSNIGRLEFWLGISVSIVGFVVIGCGATWTISSTINDKVSQSRQEIAGNIQVSKTELTTRMDRLEDKVESGFKDTNSGINDLKLLLSNSNNSQSPKR
jgi:high-affinity Fe2+/Pb2+ permease